MSVVKKIIGSSFEALKEGAKEIAEVASPERVIGQVTGHSKSGDEVRDYLKKLDPNLSKKDIEEMQRSEAEELKKTREVLTSAVPEHMRLPPKPKEPRPHERNLQERQEKERELQEAQKRQEALSLPLIVGKQRGKLGVAKRPRTTDFERGKNIKVG